MTIRNRLIKLETAAPKKREQIHLLYFIVDPENMDPIGYCCEDGMEILLQQDESEEEFKRRCRDSVDWSTGISMRIFYPIYANIP